MRSLAGPRAKVDLRSDFAPGLYHQAGGSLIAHGPSGLLEGERVPVHAPEIRPPDLGIRARVFVVTPVEGDLVSAHQVRPVIRDHSGRTSRAGLPPVSPLERKHEVAIILWLVLTRSGACSEQFALGEA